MSRRNATSQFAAGGAPVGITAISYRNCLFAVILCVHRWPTATGKTRVGYPMGLFSKRPKATKIHSLEELKPMIASGKPVLLDFMQVSCGPCQVMDGIINELAEEYGDSAHVVKVDVMKVPGAARAFNVRSTPTFVLIGRTPEKTSKKARQRAAQGRARKKGGNIQTRWRTTGLVRKDQLQRVLESNGARQTG